MSPAVDPGLCATCDQARLVRGAHSVFWMCGRAAHDPNFPRYPALPMLACPGHQPIPQARRAASAPAGQRPGDYQGVDEGLVDGEGEGLGSGDGEAEAIDCTRAIWAASGTGRPTARAKNARSCDPPM